MSRLLPFSPRALLIGLTLLLAAAGARLMTPTLHAMGPVPDIDRHLPKTVGAWQVIETATVPVSLTEGTSMSQPYNQTVMRSYGDRRGHVINVAVAWGEKQRQEIKIHRPELCYPAQGFQVLNLTDVRFPIPNAGGQPVLGKRMLTRDRNGQIEAVSYWIRIGGIYSDSAWQTRLHIFKEGMAGRIPDGVLVRMSQRLADERELSAAYSLQEQFAAELVARTEAQTQHLLVR